MLYFKSYIYPQVYEFFVKGVSERFRIELSKVKIGFDLCCLAVAIVVSLLLLHKIEGIGPGTVVLAGNGLTESLRQSRHGSGWRGSLSCKRVEESVLKVMSSHMLMESRVFV